MERTLPALIAASQWELVAAAYCLKYNYNSLSGTYVATFVYCSTRCCGEERTCCAEDSTLNNNVVNVWYFWAIVVVALFTLCLAVIAACCRWKHGGSRSRRRTRVRTINITPTDGRPQSQAPTTTSTPRTADRATLPRFTFTLPGAPPPYYPASPPPSYEEVCRQSTSLREPKDSEETEETERGNPG